MNSIKLGLFDVFGFVFPGFLALFSIVLPFIWNIPLKDLAGFFEQTKEIPFVFLLLFSSYILGASIHQLGYYWYYLTVMIIYYWCVRLLLFIITLFNKKIEIKIKALKEKHNLLNELHEISKNYILIRQFTPSQILILDEWVSKRAMSFNLSLCFLALTITSIYIWRESNHIIWLVIELFSVLSSVSLLIRAYAYDYWWKKELKMIVETFDLRNRKIDDTVSNESKETRNRN